MAQVPGPDQETRGTPPAPAVAQATHEGARAVVDFAVAAGIGTLVVGDPRGLLAEDAGKRQNLAVSNWRPGQAIAALTDKAALAGITVELVDERGTSSTCPNCRTKVAKPKGRRFFCVACGLLAHRDVVGATNIASRGTRGGEPFDPSGLEIMHRRAGRNLPGRTRRDPRRVRMDHHRDSVGPCRLWPAPTTSGSRSIGTLRRPDRGIAGLSPEGSKGWRLQH